MLQMLSIIWIVCKKEGWTPGSKLHPHRPGDPREFYVQIGAESPRNLLSVITQARNLQTNHSDHF